MATVANHQKLGGGCLKQQKVTFPSSGGRKSEIKVSAVSEGKPVLRPAPDFWWLLATLGAPRLGAASLPSWPPTAHDLLLMCLCPILIRVP